MKYIYKTKCSYIVNNHKHYGTYKRFEDAVKRVDELIEQGVLKPKELDPMRYIYLYQGKYNIIKRLNGKNEFFGRYRKLEDAQHERDFLEAIDWDYDNMEAI